MSENIEALVKAAVDQAYAEWKEEYYVDLVDHVRERLDESLDKIIAKVLGMDNKWGRWEVDHCNGRQGNSFIGQVISQRATEAAAELVNESLKNWKPTEEMKKAILGYYEEELRCLARRHAQDHARVRFDDLVDQSIAEVVP